MHLWIINLLQFPHCAFTYFISKKINGTFHLFSEIHANTGYQSNPIYIIYWTKLTNKMAECELSCAKYWVFFFNLLFAVSTLNPEIKREHTVQFDENLDYPASIWVSNNIHQNMTVTYWRFSYLNCSWLDWQYWLLAASHNMLIITIRISSAIPGSRHRYWWWSSEALFSSLPSLDAAEPSRKAHAWCYA